MEAAEGLDLGSSEEMAPVQGSGEDSGALQG